MTALQYQLRRRQLRITASDVQDTLTEYLEDTLGRYFSAVSQRAASGRCPVDVRYVVDRCVKDGTYVKFGRH